MSEDAVTVPDIKIDIAAESKKLRIVALLFCDYGIVAKDDKMSVVGVINQVNVNPDRQETGRFFVFVRLAGEVTDSIELLIFEPSGKAIARGVLRLDQLKQKTDKTLRSVQFLETLSLNPVVEGTYWFAIYHNGESIGGAELIIKYQDKEVKNGDGA